MARSFQCKTHTISRQFSARKTRIKLFTHTRTRIEVNYLFLWRTRIFRNQKLSGWTTLCRREGWSICIGSGEVADRLRRMKTSGHTQIDTRTDELQKAISHRLAVRGAERNANVHFGLFPLSASITADKFSRLPYVDTRTDTKVQYYLEVSKSLGLVRR